jgi:hypothetical protein
VLTRRRWRGRGGRQWRHRRRRASAMVEGGDGGVGPGRSASIPLEEGKRRTRRTSGSPWPRLGWRQTAASGGRPWCRSRARGEKEQREERACTRGVRGDRGEAPAAGVLSPPLVGGRWRASPRRIDGVGCARQLLPAGGRRRWRGCRAGPLLGFGREREEEGSARVGPNSERFCFFQKYFLIFLSSSFFNNAWLFANIRDSNLIEI